MGPEVRTAQRPGRAARRPPRRHRVLQPRGQERPRPAAVAEPRTVGWQPGLGHRCRSGIRAEVDPEHAGTPPRGANPPASDAAISRRPGSRLSPCPGPRSEENTSELQSLMRISYAVFCLEKKKPNIQKTTTHLQH